MNQELDQAVSDIRNQPVDDAVVEAAAARVWARISATPEAQAAGPRHDHISDCAAFQSLLPDFRAGRLSGARATLLQDHLHECVACRRVYEGRVIALPAPRPAKARINYRWAAAAVIVAAAGVSIWIAYDQYGGRTGPAIVQSVNGALYEITSAGIQPLHAGQALPDGVEIRTAKDSDAMLQLHDGSLVELRERSGFTTSQSARDITIRLSRGSVIVQAAHRSSGHLFVATADCRVAVTGTIFGVSAGAKGSRVSVIQGEVHVAQDNAEKILHPGNQIVTSPDLEPESVHDDISWSRNHDRYDAQLAALGQAIAQIQLPGLRYSSSLLGRLPADTVFFASIPNLAEYLGEAESVFQQKTAQNPELQAWMQSHGNRAAAVIEKLRAASEYLGAEIVIATLPDSDGPVFLSEIKRPGFAEFLKQSGLPAVAEERNGLVEFGSPAGVHALSGALDSAHGGIEATPFYTRINDVYHNGAGFLVCVNLNRAANLHGASKDSSRLGAQLGNAQSVILDETQVDGRMEARVSVAFDGPRTGIAAWLASPAPMGTLDYVSPEATLAAAFVVPSGVNIVDQLKVISPKELAPVREALAASLGGEFALAVDGPIVPVPSWKVIAEVYDPVAAQSAIQQAVAKYAANAAQYQEESNRKPLVATQETVDGRTYYGLAVADGGPLLEFHYTFAGGYLIAGPSRAIVAHALQIKTTGLSILRSSKVAAMMPRDHYANFSAVVYQNIGPAIAPFASLLSGMLPEHPGQQQPGQQHPSLESLGSMKPTLMAAYAESDRLTVAANADLIGPSIASLMGGNITGLAGPLASFFQPKGTRERQMSYR
jgi:ferric-dicitrate binding protein FerR (iron transport regulator)